MLLTVALGLVMIAPLFTTVSGSDAIINPGSNTLEVVNGDRGMDAAAKMPPRSFLAATQGAPLVSQPRRLSFLSGPQPPWVWAVAASVGLATIALLILASFAVREASLHHEVAPQLGARVSLPILLGGFPQTPRSKARSQDQEASHSRLGVGSSVRPNPHLTRPYPDFLSTTLDDARDVGFWPDGEGYTSKKKLTNVEPGCNVGCW
eukprot:CAMPEP_0206463754 /NCGR_PEP_ID=MMETSP0324_2-20121206/26793_1 /ASSEMBLY_ACC=CAM_ASM_000836 /TAXON_ID=2866 /ORGANISM="Crypthecodinium cohnii, Strain Seligo" /LENGTH=205 /DNA_ID=CAMNT_0053936223 /DNA_START=78 /DNA_END=695 /DNA_ORIENTATION=-